MKTGHFLQIPYKQRPVFFNEKFQVLVVIITKILQIKGPDDRVVYAGERESNGKYTFAAHINGIYHYCFSNRMSSMTPKVVMFTMEVGEAPKEHEAGDGEFKGHSIIFWVHWLAVSDGILQPIISGTHISYMVYHTHIVNVVSLRMSSDLTD